MYKWQLLLEDLDSGSLSVTGAKAAPHYPIIQAPRHVVCNVGQCCYTPLPPARRPEAQDDKGHARGPTGSQ